MLVRKKLPSEAIIKRTEQQIAEQRSCTLIEKADSRKLFRFVLSTDEVDSVGDIIRQNWSNIDRIRERGLPTLFGHDHKHIVGRWVNVWTDKVGKVTRTLAELELLPRGTSELVDTLWALCERGWIACSVGVRPLEYDFIKGSDGIDMKVNYLFEASLVAVGAHHNALPEEYTKSFAEIINKVCDPTTGRCHLSAKQQLEEKDVEPDVPQKPPSVSTKPAARDSAISGHRKSPTDTGKTMSNDTLSQKIAAAEDALVAKRDALTQLMASEVGENNEYEDELTVKANELADQIEDGEKHLAMLLRSEKALKAQVKSAADSKSDRNPYVSMQKQRAKGHNFFAALSAKVKAHGQRMHPLAVAETFYKDDPEVGIILKADTDPATMTDATWASKLVQEATAEFFDLVRDISIYQQLPGARLQFDRYGSLVIPYNSSTRGDLAGGFVGEGSAIPVQAGSYSEKTMAPKKLATISVMTNEIAHHTMPSIQALVQTQILRDTAEALDTAFFDANARSASRPAGMQDPSDGAGAANINASAGNTVANVVSDLKGVLGRSMAARVGSGGVWVMNPLRRLGLMTVQDAASGEYPFRDEVNRGTLFGYPVITSNNMDAALVSFIPTDTVVYANDYAPRIDVSDTATIHMANPASEIVSGTPTTADPVRSLYQTNSMAVRMTMGLDWIIVRANGVQVLTSVGW